MVAQMKAENDLLRSKLFESEDARLKLMAKIGELQVEMSELKQEIVRLTAKLAHFEGVSHAPSR